MDGWCAATCRLARRTALMLESGRRQLNRVATFTTSEA